MSTSIPSNTLEKFVTFGDLLRFLRRRAGLTQMELAIAVGYSNTQISRLEQNERLPDIPTIEARFVSALGIEQEPKAVARLLDLAAIVRREDAPAPGASPYKGLNYFDESDAKLFVGREALTVKLTELVLSLASDRLAEGARFLAIVGASGSGKSSLVRAGLVSSLRWNKASTDWHVYVLTPTSRPLESLATTLTQENNSVIAAATLMDDLTRDERSLQIFARRILGSKNGSRLLLVVDQFEELFALCRSEEERSAFIGNLLTAASETNGPVMVVITLRADFYASCANYPQLREALAQHQEYIGAMNDEEMRRAIEEPARLRRWEFESGLVDLLLHDVGHEPGALPLLSHALFETWQRRRGHTLTLSGYTSSGGVRGAIAETAETVFTDQFTHEQRSIARRIFLRLTELGDEISAADTRRRATFDELILKSEEAPTTHVVLKALADARLITTTEDSAEVAHEALIREWPTLRGWLEENRDGLRLHHQLTEAAQEWQALSRTPDVLYRGARLTQTSEWAATHAEEMNALEHEFLAASMEAAECDVREREAQRQRELEAARRLAESERQRAEEQTLSAGQLRKRALYLTGAFLAALLMAFAALFFSRQVQIASQQVQVASGQVQVASRLATSRELAASSIANLEVDPERSILLALEALNTSYTIEAEEALHRAVQTSRLERIISAHEPGAPMMVALHPSGNQFVTAAGDGIVTTWDMVTGKELLRLDGSYASYSPDGKRLAIVLPNKTVQLLDLTTEKKILLTGQMDANLTVAFSPDGARLATVTANNIPKVWDARTGQELVTFRGHTDLVSSAVFSPDGTRLLTASDDHTARVWDTATGEQLLNLSDHTGRVAGAIYSPDGTRIATISGSEAYIWDAKTGERLLTLAGHQEAICTFAISPDGTRLATGGLDRKIIVWDAMTGRELVRLSGHSGAVWGVAFSQDEQSLISSSADGTVRFWDLRPSREFLTIPANGSSGQIALNGDGTRLATTDGAESIQIWDPFAGKQLATLTNAGSNTNDIAMDRQGLRIFTAGQDGKIRIWDAKTGTALATIAAHTGSLNAIAISTDGKRLATASNDYNVKIWDISSDKINSNPLLTLGSLGPVDAVAFNADGSRFASGNQNGTIFHWDSSSQEILHILRGHTDSVTAIVFSPDGKQIATASSDGTAKVWDVLTGKELFTLHGHTDIVTSIAYSPDGKRIATTSRDGSAKLWDTSTGEELLTFLGDGSALHDVLFSPDGKLLVTGGESGVHIYLLHIEDLIALAKTRVTRSLSAEECQKYLHRTQASCAPLSASPTTTPIPPTTQGRICQVTNANDLYDPSFNQMIFNGLQESHNMYGWDTRVLQSASQQDYARNINEFLRGDCDLIVGLFEMFDDIKTAANANPDQKFLVPDIVFADTGPNLWTQVYATDQAAFLAGYVAASVTKSDKVGVFGGIDVPPVTDAMDGFALGVDYYNKKNGTNVKVLGWNPEKHEGLFVGGYCCAAEGRQMTQQLLDQGADVILPVAGDGAGAGALYAVKTHRDTYLIGVETDWAMSQPEYAGIILTSILKNLDVTEVRTVKAIVDGTFTGGIHFGTLETGEVGLAPFHELDSLISPKLKVDLEQLKKDIIAGKIRTKP